MQEVALPTATPKSSHRRKLFRSCINPACITQVSNFWQGRPSIIFRTEHLLHLCGAFRKINPANRRNANERREQDVGNNLQSV